MVVDWYYIVDISLLTIVVIVQIVALILLRRSKCNFRIKNQRNIITALCVCELSGAVFLIILHIIEYFEFTMALFICACFTEIFVIFTYFFMMFILTADRLLIFYLNLKYQLYVLPVRVLRLMVSVSIISLTIAITFAILIPLHEITWEQLSEGLNVANIILDTVFIVLVLTTYCYIFIAYRRQVKIKKSNQCWGHRDQFKLWVPSLIIVTFIIFKMVPDLYITASKYEIVHSGKTEIYIAYISFRIGWLVDPLIYIFSLFFKKRKIGIAHVAQESG